MAGEPVQSTADSRGVRISGQTMDRPCSGAQRNSSGYPLQSPISPSLPLPRVTLCHHVWNGLYHLYTHSIRGRVEHQGRSGRVGHGRNPLPWPRRRRARESDRFVTPTVVTDRSYGAGHKTWEVLPVQCTTLSTRIPTFRPFVLIRSVVGYKYGALESWW